MLAAKEDAEKDIVDRTHGIIFLGTPHYGSSLSLPAAAIAFVSHVLGSDTTLLFGLSNRSDLSDLEEGFRKHIAGPQREVEVASFYENMPTRVLGLFSIGLVSVSTLYLNIPYSLTLFKIVEASSAHGCADIIHAVDVNHVDLNKSPKIYKKLTDVLHELKPYAVLLYTPPSYLQLTVQL